MKKLKLSVSIEENYCLLGISTDEPDYKLCWRINDRLKMSFVKTDDLCVKHRKSGEEQSFPLFQFEDDNTMLTYRIIGNRSEAGYFLPELKNVDYLLHIQGDLVQDDLKELVAKLMALPSIRMCIPVDLGRIKERDRLQLW